MIRLRWLSKILLLLLALSIAILAGEQNVAIAAPVPSPPETASYNPATAGGGCYCTHVVKRGENLSRIALYYGTSWPYLAQINGLRNPRIIYPGQRLRVPCGCCCCCCSCRC